MQEVLALVFTYVWGAWRHRWLALVVTWIVALGGWLWVWQMPEAYVAKARIYVDTNTVLRPLLQGLAIQPDINQRITLNEDTRGLRIVREVLRYAFTRRGVNARHSSRMRGTASMSLRIVAPVVVRPLMPSK